MTLTFAKTDQQTLACLTMRIWYSFEVLGYLGFVHWVEIGYSLSAGWLLLSFPKVKVKDDDDDDDDYDGIGGGGDGHDDHDGDDDIAVYGGKLFCTR